MKPPDDHEKARGNGQVTTGHIQKNSPQPTDPTDRLQPRNLPPWAEGDQTMKDFARCLAQEFFREYALFKSFCNFYEREDGKPMDHVADYLAELDTRGGGK